jgi:hypothetical protein
VKAAKAEVDKCKLNLELRAPVGIERTFTTRNKSHNYW